MIYLVPCEQYAYYVRLSGRLALKLWGSFEHEPINESIDS